MGPGLGRTRAQKRVLGDFTTAAGFNLSVSLLLMTHSHMLGKQNNPVGAARGYRTFAKLNPTNSENMSLCYIDVN